MQNKSPRKNVFRDNGKVLADIDKVIIEKNAGSGVVPYLPLPELKKTQVN